MMRHFRALARLGDGFEWGGFFDPLELFVRSACSLIAREPFFAFVADALDVDITDVRLDTFPCRTGVVGRVETAFVVAIRSFIFELLPLFVDECEVTVVDRFPPCGEGDGGMDAPEFSSIKCPS